MWTGHFWHKPEDGQRASQYGHITNTRMGRGWNYVLHVDCAYGHYQRSELEVVSSWYNPGLTAYVVTVGPPSEAAEYAPYMDLRTANFFLYAAVAKGLAPLTEPQQGGGWVLAGVSYRVKTH